MVRKNIVPEMGPPNAKTTPRELGEVGGAGGVAAYAGAPDVGERECAGVGGDERPCGGEEQPQGGREREPQCPGFDLVTPETESPILSEENLLGLRLKLKLAANRSKR